MRFRRTHLYATEVLRQFALVATLPVLVTGFFLLWYFNGQLQRSVANQQQALARTLAEETQQHVFSAGDKVDLFVSLSLAGAAPGDFTARLDQFLGSSSYFEAIYVTDRLGLIDYIGLARDRRESRELYIGMDVSNNAMYQAKPEDDRTWSDVFLSVVTGRLSIAYLRRIGSRAVIAEIAIDRLPRLSRQLSDNEMLVMILDQNADIIGHPDPDLSQQQVNLSNLPLFDDRNAAGLTSEFFELGGVRYFGTAVQMNNPPWFVVVAQDDAVFSQPLTNAIKIWLPAMLILIAAALWVTRIRARTLSTRFSDLAHLARNIAAGDYSTASLNSHILEFQQLADNLGTMASAIERREQSLRLKEQQLRNTLELTPNVAVQWFDDDGHILFWNSASEALFGHSSQQALGKTPAELDYLPDPQFMIDRLLEVTRLDMAVGPWESPFNMPDGTVGMLVSTAFAIPDGERRHILVAMQVDITRQKQAEESIRRLNAELEDRVAHRTDELQQRNSELHDALRSLGDTMEQLVQSEKLASLGSLVAGVAHELNTPIGNALIAASSLRDFATEFGNEVRGGTLRRSTLDAFVEDAMTAAEITERNLQRASELVTGFKQVAVDQSSSQRREFALSEVIGEILLTLQPVLKRTQIEVVDDVSAEIVMDSFPGPLGQVLSNLITNAVVHGLDSTEGTVSIKAREDDGWVYLSVSDDGRGIPVDVLKNIYDPFFTTRLGQGGSGLGLHIAHQIVTDALGGEMSVRSELSRGTRFDIKLPSRSPMADQQKMPPGMGSGQQPH
ncbi:MAG: hypothetical protein DHS20C11_21010 [Lysobacteraceae bacterium]|nr:MAG: hypothetical protein DHS20C11_21010 [Xanthomonadaceae bacterium]